MEAPVSRKLSLACRAAALALSGTACTPTLFMNRSFLVPEELKLTQTGYASLKSTGETFDLTPIKAREPSVGDRVLVLEVRGSYLIVGDGWKRVWRVWPSGKDEAKFKPVELAADPKAEGATFKAPQLEASGKCGLVTWQRGAGQGKAFINADGDANEQKCEE
jgi:hypothetical protein